MAEGVVACVGLFIGLLIALEVGYRLRRRSLDNESYQASPADSVVFAILGLVIAFAFNSAASRFDERRHLIIDQANALRVAWTRVDLLAEPDREAVRSRMREWVRLVLEFVPTGKDRNAPEWAEQFNRADHLQRETWQLAMEAVDRQPKPQYAALVLTPIDQWIDLSTARVEMSNRGLPFMVFVALIVLSIGGALLAGFNSANSPHRRPMHMLLFAGVISLLIYLTVDLSLPRSGLIRTDSADSAMRRLYEVMTRESPSTTGATRPVPS